VKKIINHNSSNGSFEQDLTTQDLEQELRRLQGEADIQNADLHELQLAHKKRPYVPEFFERLRGGYQTELQELRARIRAVRFVVQQRSEAVTN
jgi:hypothetical protein